MTKEALQELTHVEEALAEQILELFAQEQAQFLEQITQLEAEIALQQEASEKQAQEQAIAAAIYEGGGKNLRAVRAILEDEDMTSNTDGSVVISLERAKAAAPYLFYETQNKIDGTGFRSGKKKQDDIGAAFKQALRR